MRRWNKRIYSKHPFIDLKRLGASGGKFLMERHGTRIKCEIPLTLSSLNPAHPFSGPGLVILANPNGCAVRCNYSFRCGNGRADVITTEVVNYVSLGPYKKVRILGLALDRPGNVWGIKHPPQTGRRNLQRPFQAFPNRSSSAWG